MEYIEGGVCAPKGFVAGGLNAGFKKSGKNDLSIVYSENPCVASGIYTKNKVKGAPLLVTQGNLSDGKAQAIICNSGNANTCNKNGLQVAQETCNLLGETLRINPNDVIVASTGIIGQELDFTPFVKGIPKLGKNLSQEGGNEAAKGIMTTDTAAKEMSISFNVDGKDCVIGGMAKGSGMIHPNMATMLCFITSDISISKELLDKAIKEVADETFNQISVDGDTSTNDMVTIMANGLCGNKQIIEEGESYFTFLKVLKKIMLFFAKAIAADGEGASKLVEVKVEGAPSLETARKVSKEIVSSNLFKAAIFGADANWGRVMCALGNAENNFSVDNIDVALVDNTGLIKLCQGSKELGFSEKKATDLLSKKEVVFYVNLNNGDYIASAWGCDLTYDYVKINGDYRS